MGERGLIIMIEELVTVVCGMFLVVVIIVNPIYMMIKHAIHEYRKAREDKE